MFIAEALDHLGTIEAAVLALDAAPGDVKLLNDIFRPFHTVKGNSGALGVRTVQWLAHRVENLLDLGRSGKHRIGERETEVILKSVDLLTAMMTDLQRRRLHPRRLRRTRRSAEAPTCRPQSIRARSSRSAVAAKKRQRPSKSTPG